MKKIIALFLIFVVCLLTASCSAKNVDVPDGMQLASGSDVSYNLFVPGGWIIAEGNGINGAYYSSSDRSNITVSSFYPEAGMESIADYWNACKESYGETYKNFSSVEEETQLILGEKASLKYVFTADIDGVSYKFMQVITVHDNMFLTLVYTAEAEKYDSHLADVEKVISEFEFK